MMMKHASALLVLVAFVGLAQTSSRTVAGVVSGKAGSVVPNARVTLTTYDENGRETSQATQADETGHYAFRNISASQLRLSASNSEGAIPIRQRFTNSVNNEKLLVINITAEWPRPTSDAQKRP